MGRCQEVAFFGGSKQCKFMVIWRDFPYNNAWFGSGGEEIHHFFEGVTGGSRNSDFSPLLGEMMQFDSFNIFSDGLNLHQLCKACFAWQAL